MPRKRKNTRKLKPLVKKQQEADKVIAKLASVLMDRPDQRFFVSGEYLGPSFVQKKFQPGKDKIYYALSVYGDEEKQMVQKALDDGWLGLGKYSAQFSKKVAKILGKKHGVFLNSGSSGTMLALKVLDLPAGSEVITPACNFATTIAAILNNNLIPVVADNTLGTYNLNLDYLPKMVGPKTKAIMTPHVIGSLNDMKRLRRFANKHKLYLIEDSCDTLGGSLNGRPTGELSDISVCSFYASHHITTAGSGGMLCADNDTFLARAIAYRDWGRFGDDNEDVGERFNLHIDGIPYDRKFVYSVVGYNLKPTEIQAAFGLAQLKKLAKFNARRRRNIRRLRQYLKRYKDFFLLPQELKGAKVVWLAFPITLKDGAPFTRLELINHLEKNNIQVRLLFSGNIFRQPAFKNAPRRVVGELPIADKIMRDSMVIGCHQGLTDEMIDYVCSVFDDFMRPYVKKTTLV